ncbi:MAG: TonB-dependent receptor [Prevotellaceae bacterium]|nr:TonB-dependent receptor [Prevotellaceae bacterium]
MRLLALLALLFIAHNRICAETLYDDTLTNRTHHLEEVVVSESKSKRELTSSSPLYILENEQFLKMGITDISDALNRLPGITLRDYGGAGGLKTVSVRGFGAQHTGVSYDGVMLSECQSGQIDVSRYSLDNVGSISLVIGDNDDIFISAKHAASAAILDITTLNMPSNDLRPHLTTQVRLGSFGYVSPFIRYEQNFSNKLAMSIVGEYIYAENDYPFTLKNVSITKKENRTNSRMNSGHGEMNMVWRPNAFNIWKLKLYYYDNDRQLPGQVRYYTNVSKEKLHDQNFFVQIGYRGILSEKLSLKSDAKFNWAASKYKNDLYKGNVNDASYWQREVYTSTCLLYEPNNNLALDYSVDYGFNNLNSSLSTDTKPYRHSVLQSATAKYHNRRFTAIARLLGSLYFNDAKLGEGAKDMKKLSPSLSLSYKLFADNDLYVRASYKNIFRTPTFNESYFYHYGSTTLNPEKTDQYNIGVTLQTKYGNFSNIRFTVDGYLNHVTDKIVAVPYNMFVWTCVNVGKVRMIGIDASTNLNYKFNDKHSLLFAASYSYQKAENRTNRESEYYGYQIAYTPEHSGSMSITYNNPWVDMTLHGTGTSMRYGNNEHYEGTDINGYWDMGVTLSRSFSIRKQSIELRCDLKNILNTQYEIVRMYPMPGFNWQFTLKYKF